ncbi:hypothetical protein McanMca71_006403 [Microsporum canis]
MSAVHSDTASLELQNQNPILGHPLNVKFIIARRSRGNEEAEATILQCGTNGLKAPRRTARRPRRRRGHLYWRERPVQGRGQPGPESLETVVIAYC